MITCDDCGIGRYRPVHAPYVWRTAGRTSIVPDVPAIQCDVCGQLYYDEAAIYNLHLLIDHGSKGVKNKKSRLKSADHPHWPATRRGE